MITDRQLLAPAAKFDDSDGRYHPLLCHLLDTAAVSLALWDRVLPVRLRRLIADDLGLEDEAARSWVAMICALHDLGKASPCFQRKDRGAPARLDAAGLPLGDPSTDPGHGLTTAVQVDRLLRGRGVSPRLAQQAAAIAGGHHGIFPLPRAGEGQGAHIGERSERDRMCWSALREQLVEAVWRALAVTNVPGRLPGNASMMAMAGLVTVADWIASNEELFPWAGQTEPAPDEYWQRRALPQATRALEALHWLLPPPRGPLGFADLFPGVGKPRPVQEAVLSASASEPPECLIVEAPTGEGKTEAALLWVEQWARRGAPGVYVAMPTQTTSNQLYGRLRAYVGRLFKRQSPDAVVPLMLVHGAPELAFDIAFLPSGVFDGDTPDQLTAGAAEWFLPRKRALLAPFGVGTIDQALLAALRVKHVFVRLFGLAGKPVVIDEVHAYDAYMSTLLERLLEWLGALGSPVALLSATLPAERRRTLLRAYLRGAGRSDAGAETHTHADAVLDGGPRITYSTSRSVESKPVEVSPGAVRRVRVERVPDDPATIAHILAARLSGGGCAAVICNTVMRAQETYVALRTRFGQSVCQLFHARFLARDRHAIERACLDRFGPPRPHQARPRLGILVATQVVEQSLDLDFDILVSDLAPLDLLIQRAGRLQRHRRGARPVPGPPTLLLRWPEGTPPAVDSGTRAIYSEHVLLRTWAVLRSRDWIAVPDDVSGLIDYVYAEADVGCPEDVADRLEEIWRESWADLQERRCAQENQARDKRLLPPDGPPRLPSEFQRNYGDEDELELDESLKGVTRLATPSVDVVLVGPDDPLLGVVSRGSGRLPAKVARNCLLQSVAISSPAMVAALRAAPVPRRFAKTPGLRRHRLIALDSSGAAEVGRLRLRLDSELGVVIDRVGPVELPPMGEEVPDGWF